MIKNYRYRTKIAYRSSNLFCILNTFRYPNSSVRGDTEVTIDGFQRSANTYAYYYFKELNSETKIAHHSHSFRQIIYSVEKNIPTILLIRDPFDTILSTYIYHFKKVSFNVLAESWINFYKPLLSYKSHLVISDFDKTISNFNKKIAECDLKFDTHFKCHSKFHNTKDFEDKIQMKLSDRKIVRNRQSMPSNERHKVKENTLLKLPTNLKDYNEDLKNIYTNFLK